MDKKKIAIAALIVVVLIIVVNVIVRQVGKDPGYVFDGSKEITLKEVRTNLRSVKFSDDNVRDFFSKKVINPLTIKFFKSLEKRFENSKNWDEHYEGVLEYLKSVLPPDEAQELFALYKKYMEYQQKLMEDSKAWGSPQSAEDAIKYLHKLQNYRREYFGKDVADILWGAEVKMKEYPIRRGVIISDANLYGAEKEKRLSELNKAMWGDEAQDVEGYAKPYVRYQEKLSIYKRDLDELKTEDERQQRIREFRKDIFPPDVVERLDAVDKLLADEKKKEDEYSAKEREIMSDPNLDSNEKEEKIRELQNSQFGDEADAFRRRQAIDKGLEELKSGKK